MTEPMPWMRMPGQTWLGAALSFERMWLVMMAAMMLPSLLPALRRYALALSGAGEVRRAALIALVGVAYLVVWLVIGVAIFPLGVALASAEIYAPTLARAVPVAAGVVVLIAGALQFTAWKAHHLACWRELSRDAGAEPPRAGAAWRHGLRLGVHCAGSSVGATAVLLAVGLMDVRAMVAVTAAITVERLAAAAGRAPRILGGVGVAAGVVLIARAAGVG